MPDDVAVRANSSGVQPKGQAADCVRTRGSDDLAGSTIHVRYRRASPDSEPPWTDVAGRWRRRVSL